MEQTPVRRFAALGDAAFKSLDAQPALNFTRTSEIFSSGPLNCASVIWASVASGMAELPVAAISIKSRFVELTQ